VSKHSHGLAVCICRDDSDDGCGADVCSVQTDILAAYVGEGLQLPLVICEMSSTTAKKVLQGFHNRRQTVLIEIPGRIFIVKCNGNSIDPG
jgi:hypothetical protein